MRIDRLSIRGFKNLRDVALDFDESSLSTVILGQNGTGKSNLLEALVVIFRDLDLAESPRFAYGITYRCRGSVVQIDAEPGRKPRHTTVTVDGESVSFARFTSEDGRVFRPQNLFGYYSGPSNRLQSHFERHTKIFKDQLIRPDAEERGLPRRPLFYAQAVHSQFVLLSFFLDADDAARAFLRNYLRVEGLDSVLFVMKRPEWERKTGGDRRFWGARGVVRGFLDRLFAISLAPLRTRPGRPDEHLYLFIKDAAALDDLYAPYRTQGGRQGDFFKSLESTHLSDLIADVRIRVQVRGADGVLTFRELSEGEQQLLIVLGLLRFTREEESLFLLDEPDTHLNPAWSLEYLELLQRVVGERETSHILITTHDPVMIAGLVKEQVLVLYRDVATGEIRAKQADEDPKGQGVAALLTSELFGLRSQVDLETMRKLDRKRELASTDSLGEAERAELEELTEELGNLDFTRSVRDPLYGEFVRAMEQTDTYRRLKKPTLTVQERRDQRRLAEQVVQQLKLGIDE